MNPNPSSRDRIAELVIIVACSGGAWWIAAKPFHDRAALASAHLEATRAELAEATAVKAEDPQRAAAVMKTVSTWSDAHADPLLVGGMLQQAADDAGVHIDRLSPAEDDSVNTFGSLALTSRKFELITTGSARSIIDFLDAIDHRPLVVVHSFELAPGAQDDDVSALVHVQVTRIALSDAVIDGDNQ